MMQGTQSQSVARSTSTFIRVKREFLRFLRDKEGCLAMNALEDSLGVEISLENHGFTIIHDCNNTDTDLVEQTLRHKWYDFEFTKAMRVSMLHRLCPHSVSLQLSISRAALLAFHSASVIRESGVIEILIDASGYVCLFGVMSAIQSAQHNMERIFDEYLASNPMSVTLTRSPSSLTHNTDTTPSPRSSTDSQIGEGQHMGDQQYSMPHISPINMQNISNISEAFMSRYFSCYNQSKQYENNQTRYSQSTTPPSLDVNNNNNNNNGRRKRERLTFMVRSGDAPRLIGTRGVNKKRIEEVTNSSIILHTESKRDGEFPVEVVAANIQQCESARAHIESFLASGSTVVDDERKEIRHHHLHMPNSPTEQLQMRERPKVYLQFSPKKSASFCSSPPQCK